jgi:glycerol uptake facilitator-like aquaporin
MKAHLLRRVVAEFFGTGFLVAAVVGSGIMAERLSGGNVALALLANTIATGAALVAIILAFGPISGAHLNPVVSLADAIEGGLRWPVTPFAVGAYITAAYWFTASTSFANPAVTIARSLSDTFAGIRPADAPAFVMAQAIGALLATFLFRWLAPELPESAKDVTVPHEEAEAEPAAGSTRG